jgi:uncharacterized phage-associated protein
MIKIRKILQSLYYIQNNTKNSERFNIVYLLKILYFADRHHIRHFGFLGSSDTYCAMRYGPVASATFDILKGKMPPNASLCEAEFLKEVESLSETEINIAPQEYFSLSPSFKQSLDFSIKTYGKFKAMQLSEITHDYPEWIKNQPNLEKNNKSNLISLTDFFENPSALPNSNKHKITSDPFADEIEFLEAVKETVSETSI